MTELKRLPLSSLILDIENPRFAEIQENQRSSIRNVVLNNVKKCLVLSQDIAENGLSPVDNFIVIKSSFDQSLFIALEGNRRLCSAKILENPEIVIDLLAPLQANLLKGLSKQYLSRRNNEANCVLFGSREEAEHWIELRHTGQNEGAGLVPWGSPESSRFKTRSGVKEPHIQILDYLEGAGLLSSHTRKDLPTSSFKRLMSDKYIKDKIGISTDVFGKVESVYDKNEISKPLLKIINDLASGNVKVDSIYHKDDRKVYIDNLGKESLPDGSLQLVQPTKLENLPDHVVSTIPSRKKPINQSIPSTNDRKYLFPSGFSMKIGNQRVNDIYHELRALEVGKYRNAISVLLRVFLELSVDSYIESNTLPKPTKIPERNWTLKDKIFDVASDLFTKEKITKGQKDAVEVLASSNKPILASVFILHSYIHNSEISPLAVDLKASWDTLQDFIVAIWKS